jgi:hypothetical protein
MSRSHFPHQLKLWRYPLLTQHRLATLKSTTRQRGMERSWKCHVEGMNLFIFQQLAVGGKCPEIREALRIFRPFPALCMLLRKRKFLVFPLSGQLLHKGVHALFLGSRYP